MEKPKLGGVDLGKRVGGGEEGGTHFPTFNNSNNKYASNQKTMEEPEHFKI